MGGEAPATRTRPAKVRQSWWDRRIGIDPAELERIAAAFEEFGVDFKARAATSSERWVQSAKELHAAAERHKAEGEIDPAWTLLKAAQRELLNDYTDAELQIERRRCELEASHKLRGWRKEVVSWLLAPQRGGADASRDDDHSPSVASADPASQQDLADVPLDQGESTNDDLRMRVIAARVIFDEYQDNEYRKLRLLQGHLLRAGALLAFALLLSIGVLIWVLNVGWSPDESDWVLADWRSLLVVASLGALGSTVSHVLQLLRPDSRARIPDVRAQRMTIWLGPIVGAAAALIVVAIARSGIGGITLDPGPSLVLAFVAGFSERLLRGSVAAAAKAVMPQDTRADADPANSARA